MHLAFDAKRLFANRSGLGNYSRTLVGNLLQLAPELKLGLYTTRIDERIDTAAITSYPYVYTRHKSGWGSSAWRSYGITSDLKRAGVELYHGLSQELPRGLRKADIRSVVTLHDLIQQIHPEQFGLVDRTIYNVKVRHAVHHADAVIAITDHTRQDILERYPTVDPARVHRLYQSCDPLFWSDQLAALSAATAKAFGLPAAYNLFVGSLIPRKNIGLILQAYYQLPVADRLPLVLVGRGDNHRRSLAALAQRLGLADLLHWLPNVDTTSQLREVYAGAKLFIYPSLYEGFGIPLIESTLCGTPVISSTMPALQEAGGPDARYVSPHDPEELAASMVQLQGDDALRKEMVLRSQAYVREQFAGPVLSQKLLKLYASLG